MQDRDSNGKISKDEIKRALKFEDIDDSILDQYVTEYDINGDGEIDYNELLNLMGKLSLK